MSIASDVNSMFADQMFAIYSHAETLMLDKVARRIERGITTEGWNEKKLREISALQQELKALTEDLEKLSQSKIESSVGAAYAKGIASANSDFNLPESVLRTTTVPAKLQFLLLEANNLVKNINISILRDTLDIYRKIQAEVATGVLTGVETRQQIARRALNKFADNGITGFTDKAGRKWEMASYVEMATRSVTARAAIEGHLERQTEYGRDLVIVSDHAGECPVCRQWEGKILSVSGKDQNYPSLASARMAGLFHPNCRHTVTGYIPGLTKLDKPKNAGVPEQYEYTQKQRYNERMIRQWKRRETVAITPQDKMIARNKIKFYQGKQREMLKEYEDKFGMSLRRKYDRESIVNRTAKSGKDNGPAWLEIKPRKIPVIPKVPDIPAPPPIPAPAPEKPKKERTFNQRFSGMKKRFTPEEWVEVKARLEGSPDFVLKLFEKNQNKIEFGSKAYKDGAHYAPSQGVINMNLATDIADSQNKGALTTFFHEVGHLFDDKMGRNKKVKPEGFSFTVNRWKVLSSDKEFVKAIQEDYNDMLNSPMFKGKPEPFINGKLTDMLRQEGDIASGVQDMYSGLSLNKIRPKWGHATEYWTRGNRPEEIASETFAHMVSAYTDPRILEKMQKWFPKTTRRFEEIVRKKLKI